MKIPCTAPASDTEQMAAQYRRVPLRKHISDRTCSGKETPCMPALNGRCAACVDDN